MSEATLEKTREQTIEPFGNFSIKKEYYNLQMDKDYTVVMNSMKKGPQKPRLLYI